MFLSCIDPRLEDSDKYSDSRGNRVTAIKFRNLDFFLRIGHDNSRIVQKRVKYDIGSFLIDQKI